MKNFAIVGAAGYIAPRHLEAIQATGNRLIAALDPSDSVGHLDRFALDVQFFTELERFERFLEKCRRGNELERIHYLTVCSPNYLHDAHCRLGLRSKADVICEKPLVVNPWNLDALADSEAETGRRVWTVLQLRVHDKIRALHRELTAAKASHRHEVVLTYVTARGSWYDISWKGDEQKSGGIPVNIGIHFFDVLVWLFGAVEEVRVHLSEPRRMSGLLVLERARVRWFLSVDAGDLPFPVVAGKKTTHRSLTIDGSELDFTDGIDRLHTRVYEEILAGKGHGIEDARPSVQLVHDVRHAPVTPAGTDAHPILGSK